MTQPCKKILIECPHALSGPQDIGRYTQRIELCFQQKNMPLLIPELSQKNTTYLPYADFIWRWQQEAPEKNNGEYSSPSLKTIEGDPLLGLFTSGSSSMPKLIWHRLSHYHHAAKRSAELLEINKESTVLSALPCYHNGGFLNLIRAKEYPHILSIVSHKDLISTWQQQHPHIVIGVPTQLQQALERIDNLDGVTFYCGGAALNTQLWQQALDRGMNIFGTYGLTESCGAILYKQKPQDAYQTMDKVEVSISNDKHLQFDCPSNAEAFQKGPELTLAQTPWETSDRARIDIYNDIDNDKDGIHIEGRADQVIICSGENISPTEITKFTQQFLIANNIVTEIQLIGMPDAIKGQIPILLIMGLENWSEEKCDKLSSFLRERLSPLQRPRFMMGTLHPNKGIKITPSELQAVFDDPQTKVWKI